MNDDEIDFPERDIIDAYVPREGEKCWLDSEWGQCCCVCRWHLPDFEHCAVNEKLREEKQNCICNILKGYICYPPDFGGKAFSGWPRHSIGCELFTPQEKGGDNMPKKDGKGPPSGSKGPRDGSGKGKGGAPGKGIGSKKGGKKGKC